MSHLRVLFVLTLAIAVASPALAAPIYTAIGQVSNNTNPSEWTRHEFDVTALIVGASNAVVSFDLRNDGPPFTPDNTISDVSFGVDTESPDYFLHLEYAGGNDFSHWRDVQLLLDGVLYRDQFASFNDHLGDPLLGTLSEGGTNLPFEATTYILSVPEPSSAVLLALGFSGLGITRRRIARSR